MDFKFAVEAIFPNDLEPMLVPCKRSPQVTKHQHFQRIALGAADSKLVRGGG